MKVIVAGFAKTGTKSMHIALRELGYEVYDFVENFWYLGKDWNKILTEGGSVDDFKRMYKDVDATIDTPVYFFWKEIHEAFPDAKIVFTTRDEDSWFPSYRKQIEEMEKSTMLRLMFMYSPLGRKFGALLRKMIMDSEKQKPHVTENRKKNCENLSQKCSTISRNNRTADMKVIVSGFPKNGTKSMTVALRELGYEVYDFVENF
ncbi:unnamed protein product [Clavelina lepadiformis]|uniref:Sulfotransferase family protein n=1 Tax=Clavelina lepadiformis TaxID=159417 RepID=A0ABP0FP62_CLALP